MAGGKQRASTCSFSIHNLCHNSFQVCNLPVLSQVGMGDQEITSSVRSSRSRSESQQGTPWKNVDYAVRMVLALETHEAASYLKSLEQTKPELYREVIWFLEAQRELSGFMENPVAEKLSDLFVATGPLTTFKTAHGEYKVLDLLGEGGMGKVYLAQRQDKWGRKVALKTLRDEVTAMEAPTRFENESKLLAALNHPAFPHIYECGYSVDEKPYFTMEYVKGETLSQYCRSQQLGVAERLKLFVKICEGIDYAHQQGILHRDLKPENVLVTSSPLGPLPKIIDFGIAKSFGVSTGNSQVHTRIGSVLGTPAYMSPEQWQAARVDIDLRTDVYALGVMLFELLTGLPPQNMQHLEGLPLDEAWRQLREAEWKRPSIRLREASDQHLEQEFGPHIQRGNLVKNLRRELDWIVAKAMARNRYQRYASAAELAADVRAYLQNHPISPKRSHKTYLLTKFTQRHGSHLWCIFFTCLFMLTGGIFWVSAMDHTTPRTQQVLEIQAGDSLGNPTQKKNQDELTAHCESEDRFLLEKEGKQVVAELLGITNGNLNPYEWPFVKVGY